MPRDDSALVLTRRRALGVLAGTGTVLFLSACGSGTAAVATVGVTTAAQSVTASSSSAVTTSAAGTATASAASATTSGMPAQAPPKQGQTVLTMLTRGDNYIFTLFRNQYAVFSKEHPDIYVRFDDAPSNYYQKLQIQIAGGTPPDLLFECDCSIGTSYRNKIVESVDPYLAKTKDFSEDAFDKGSWFAMTYGGKRWGLPWDSGGCALFFNIDLFNAAQVPLPDPTQRWTWDQLLDAARKLTVDANGKRLGNPGFDPAHMGTYGFNSNTSWGLMRFIFGNGGEPLLGSPDQPPAEHTVPFDTSAVIDGIQWLADLAYKYQVMPNPAYKPATSPSITNKNVAIEDDGVWLLGRVNAAKVNWGVMPFPKGKLESPYGHYSPLAMLTSSKDKEATWTWMYWATLSEPGQTMLVDAGQMQPMRKSLHQRFVDNPNPPDKKYRQVFIDELTSPNLRVTGDKVGSYWDTYRQEWTQVTGPIYDQVFRGSKTMKELASQAKQELEPLLKTGKVSTS